MGFSEIKNKKKIIDEETIESVREQYWKIGNCTHRAVRSQQ